MNKVRRMLSIMLIFLMVLSMMFPLLAETKIMDNENDGEVIGKTREDNSIYFEDVTVGDVLTVSKEDNQVRIVASGTSDIVVTVLTSGTILIEVELIGGGFEKVTIPASVSKGADIGFYGSFKDVEIRAKNIVLDVDEGSTVETVTASKAAEGSQIVGEGSISNVVIKAENIIVELKGTTVIVEEGVKGTVINGNEVEGGTETVIEDDNIPPTTEGYVIILNKTSETMLDDTTLQLISTVTYNNATSNDVVIWSSTDESVASVDQNGLVTANTSGYAVIWATTSSDSSAKVSCEVTVLDESSNLVSAVNFDTGEGNNLEKQLVYVGEAANYVIPVYNGYEFVHWTIGGEEYDFDTPIAEDITLVAVWEIIDIREQSVNDADAEDHLTIAVEFNVKVDEATALEVSNYIINEKFNSQNGIIVESVVLVDDSGAGFEGKIVKLTLATGLEANTLYELKAVNVGTYYGQGYDADAEVVIFTGVSGDFYEPSGITVVAVNSTQISITLDDDSDAADEYDLSLFSIAEKYGAKAVLTVVSIENIVGKTIILNTSGQEAATLYELKIAPGLADEWGNTTTNEIIGTFTGIAVADLISSITSVEHDVDGITLVVNFDADFDESALNAVNYKINLGIGHPQNVVKIDDNSVELTINETSFGVQYQLKVNDICNYEGIPIDEYGLVTTFIGNGSRPIKPALEAAAAVNNQTINLYFNKDVDIISGLSLDNLSITGLNEIDFTGAVIHKDVFNNSKYVVTLDSDNGLVDTNASMDGIYTVTFEGTELEFGYNSVEMAARDEIAIPIEIIGMVAVDAKTVKAYFNQTVRYVNPADITIDLNGSAVGGVTAFIDAVADNESGTEWTLSLEYPMTSEEELDIVIAPVPDISMSAAGVDNIPFGDDPSDFILSIAGYVNDVDAITDIAAVMINEKSMIVYFPVDMDKTQAEIITNYAVGTYTIVLAEYDDYATTLTFSDVVADNSNNLVLQGALVNKDLTNNVEDELEVQFAVSTASADMVLIDDVTIAGQVMTIGLNQNAINGTDITTAAHVLDLFDITINANETVPTNSTIISAVDILDENKVAVDDTTLDSFRFIQITFTADTLRYNSYGSVAFNVITGDPDTLTGINAEIQDTSQRAVIFVQE